MHDLSFNSNAHALARVVFSMLGGLSTCLLGSPSPNTQFTVEIVTPNSATKTVIETNASWRYFKGTSNPNAGWDSADEVFLGSAWKTSVAGFGYGNQDHRTLLTDMQNSYSTLYLRTTFSYDQVLDRRRLKLRIDYDDGFIAYLDGKEFARVNAPGEPGQRPPYNSLATASHKASRSPGGNPVETWYFELGSPALYPHASEGGDLVPHILAIQGLNRAVGDDAFSLIPTLYLENLFTVLTNRSVQLAGRLNMVGATAVLVNGAPTALDLTTGTWSITHPLKPGMNRLIIQARDNANNVLASRTKDIIAKSSSQLVSGTISSNTSWDASKGVIEVTGSVDVASGATLTIGQGTTVLFRPGTALGTTGGSINVAGTASNRVYFLPADGQTPWGGLAARQPGASLTLSFTEMAAAGIYLTNNATVLLEDTCLRDFSYDQAGLERYIAYALGDCRLTARRCVFSRYYTMAFGGRIALQIEDCLFEYAEHDFLKPQDTTPDSLIRRCTFAHSTVSGTDGIDTGANAQLTVDNCLFYDIPDKAISLEDSIVTVANSLFYDCGFGVAVKDDSDVILNHNTIVNSTYGIAVYLKNAGARFAHAAATNNIVWGNSTNITLRNPETGATSPTITIAVGFSDVGGGSNFPGTGNIRGDPRFIRSSSGDFRLAMGSPALGTGARGVDMGAPYLAGASQSPGLVQQPLSQTGGLTSNLTLRVTTIGSPPIFYQWRFRDADIPGATAPSLVVSNLHAGQEGGYHVLISNHDGSVHSAPAMVMLDDPLRINGTPTATGKYNLRLSGPAGSTLILQTSSNLATWDSVFTNAAPTGIIEFTDAEVTNTRTRFYRTASAP